MLNDGDDDLMKTFQCSLSHSENFKFCDKPSTFCIFSFSKQPYASRLPNCDNKCVIVKFETLFGFILRMPQHVICSWHPNVLTHFSRSRQLSCFDQVRARETPYHLTLTQVYIQYWLRPIGNRSKNQPKLNDWLNSFKGSPWCYPSRLK